MDRETWKELGRFTFRVVVVHCLTYFMFGLVMSNLLDYEGLFQREIIRDFMLPLDARTLLGVALQPVRGLLFAVALWPIREVVLQKRRGWLIVWSIFLVFGILSTTGAAPSSIEGVLYTRLPLWYHLLGLPEITLQTLAFSYLLVWWDKRQSMRTGVKERRKGFFSELLTAIAVGCFAYIGYAVGSLAVFFLSETDIDFSSAAGDIRNHLMFVVAFAFNVAFVLVMSRRWRESRISLWAVWGLAWALDTLVLFVYQSIFYGSSTLTTALLIALLPGVIIALGIRQNYKRPQESPAP
jgi:hypothetical protein